MEAFIPRNPEFKERILKKLEGQAFMDHIGFEITEIGPGRIQGEMMLMPIHKQQFGRLHGGVVTTVADIVAGFACYSLAPAEKDVVTGEIKVSYLRPGHGDRIIAIGQVLKPGKTVIFAEAEVYAEKEGERKLIAKATTTMVMIDRVLPY